MPRILRNRIFRSVFDQSLYRLPDPFQTGFHWSVSEKQKFPVHVLLPMFSEVQTAAGFGVYRQAFPYCPEPHSASLGFLRTPDTNIFSGAMPCSSHIAIHPWNTHLDTVYKLLHHLYQETDLPSLHNRDLPPFPVYSQDAW